MPSICLGARMIRESSFFAVVNFLRWVRFRSCARRIDLVQHAVPVDIGHDGRPDKSDRQLD
jgi:hypothetical protein